MRVVTSEIQETLNLFISQKAIVNDKGVSTSVIVRKLGTLKELLPEHGPTRDDVMAWAREGSTVRNFKIQAGTGRKTDKTHFPCRQAVRLW